ncbi:hypothetical protein ACUV84_009052 [Puccinellia chinampoensis]
MGKVTMQLALVALVLVGLMLAGQEADGGRPASSGGFISYSALGLRANMTADAGRPPVQANHHTRGCSKITRCRG